MFDVKTDCLYNEGVAKLINIRLNDEDERKLAALREQGVEVSDLVRQAIRSAYDRSVPPAKMTGQSAMELLRQLDEQYPDVQRDSAIPHPLDRHAFAEAAAAHFGRVNRRQAK